jgi:hypothetical protein
MPEPPTPPVSLWPFPMPHLLTRSTQSCGCTASARGGAHARRSPVGAPRPPVTPRQAHRPACPVRIGTARTRFACRPRQLDGPCRTGLGARMGRLAGPQRVGPLWSPVEQWSFLFSI